MTTTPSAPAPALLRHFWDPGENASDEIRTVADPKWYTREDVVWSAWESILLVYFPDRAQTPGGVRYRVRRGLYCPAPRPPETLGPNVVVVERNIPRGEARQPGAIIKRDILWVESKPSSEGRQPGAWNRVMAEAAARLSYAHPNRNLYVILAIGLEWMIFEWQPRNQQRPLKILADNRTDVVHPHMSVTPVADQSHLVRSAPDGPADLIDTTFAYSLDFWSMRADRQQPLNLPALQLLEDCFTHIRNATDLDTNPSELH